MRSIGRDPALPLWASVRGRLLRTEPAARTRLARHLPTLSTYAMALTRDRERAQDLVQASALRALRAARVPDSDSAFRVWLLRICRNLHIDELRRMRLEPEPCADPDEASQPPPDPAALQDRVADVLSVHQALARLPVHHREVIVLVDLVGFSYREAGEALGVPPGTVMSRLSRARAALLRLLQDPAAAGPEAGG